MTNPLTPNQGYALPVEAQSLKIYRALLEQNFIDIDQDIASLIMTVASKATLAQLQALLDGFEVTANKNAPGGYAGLDASARIPLGLIPTSVATQDFVDAAINTLLGGAGSALDTLQELGAALSGDANFAASMVTALANRLRIDAAQAMQPQQIAQALTNLGFSEAGRTFAAASDKAEQRAALGFGNQGDVAPIYGARAWVNFDATSAIVKSGSYALTSGGGGLVVTMTGHGLTVGKTIALNLGATPPVSGVWRMVVTEVISANQFKTNFNTPGSYSGTCTFGECRIRASGNVAYVHRNARGDFHVFFTTYLPDNYVMFGSADDNTINNQVIVAAINTVDGLPGNTPSIPCRVSFQASATVTGVDPAYGSLVFFG